MIHWLLLGLFAQALDSPALVWGNNQSAQMLQEKKATEAQSILLREIQKEPEHPVLNLNLGFSFFTQGQIEKAQQSWLLSLKNANTDLEKFLALFNLGSLAQANKNEEQAMKYYQQALHFRPNSREAKTNIELLLQKQQQEQGGQGDSGDQEQEQDQQQQDQDKEQEQPKSDENKNYKENKPQPKPFQGEQLDKSDVNKILGEIQRQEQKIRAEFHKSNRQEAPVGNDW